MYKVRYTLISILPLLGAFILRVIAAMGLMLWDGLHGMDITNATKNLVYQADLSLRSTYLYAAAGVVIFGFYYLFGTTQTRYEKMQPLFSSKTVIAVIVAGIGFEGLISGTLNIIMMWRPELLAEYQHMVQVNGYARLEWISMACTIVLTPMLEEFLFRGIAVHFLRKATYNFYVVNLLQAVMFGIFHRNLVQAVYTFVLGLFFGYLYYKYGSLIVSMVVHMIINATGILLANYGSELAQNPIAVYIVTGISLLMVFGSTLLFSNDCPAIDTDGYVYDVSKTVSKKMA